MLEIVQVAPNWKRLILSKKNVDNIDKSTYIEKNKKRDRLHRCYPLLSKTKKITKRFIIFFLLISVGNKEE